MSGRYQAYPEYKDSGVEWLGAVPKLWAPKPLKFITEFINGNAFKPSEWAAEGIPIIRIENLNGGDDFNFHKGKIDPRYEVKKNDLLFGWSGNRGTSFGPFLWGRDGKHYLNQHIFRLDGFQCSKRWLYWTLRAVTYYIEEQAHGIIGMVHVTKGKIGGIPIPEISLPEQTQIAAFLDHETAKIDRLIEKQQALIALLKEKRQAVISHAVTKGLNPHAPLKDSGIEWLGDIPTYWEVKKLKHVVLPLRGIQIGPFGGMLKDLKTEPTAFKLYGQENTINDDFASGSRWLSEAHFNSLTEYELQPGDLVLTRKGASIGHCRIVPSNVQRGIIDSDTIRVRLDLNLVSARFAVTLMHEGYMESAILQRQKGSVLPGLNSDTIANLPIALPSPEEQKLILAFLSNQIARFNALSAAIHRAVTLLQERRTALISAAVTGKIDVRRWQPSDPQRTESNAE